MVADILDSLLNETMGVHLNEGIVKVDDQIVYVEPISKGRDYLRGRINTQAEESLERKANTGLSKGRSQSQR